MVLVNGGEIRLGGNVIPRFSGNVADNAVEGGANVVVSQLYRPLLDVGFCLLDLFVDGDDVEGCRGD